MVVRLVLGCTKGLSDGEMGDFEGVFLREFRLSSRGTWLQVGWRTGRPLMCETVAVMSTEFACNLELEVHIFYFLFLFFVSLNGLKSVNTKGYE